MTVFSDSNFFSLTGLTVLLLFPILFVFISKWFRAKDLPPGPRGWPLLGYIDFIFSEKPAKLLIELKKKYGNVFGFYVGSQYCVTLSDYTSVKEGGNKNSIQSRPTGYLRTSTEFPNFSEMDRANWEIHRYFISNCFRSLGVGRTRFEEIVQEELSRAMPKMESFAGKPECVLRDVIKGSINNTMIQLICSRWFEDDHPIMIEFLNFLTLTAESFSNNVAFVYFPWLDWPLRMFHPHYKAIARSFDEISNFVRSEIKSRLKNHDENSNHDYIDFYLNEMKSGKVNLKYFNKDHLVANCLLLLMAGSDTTRNTLEWLMMAMAKHPEIQEKVYREIVSVVGPEKCPTIADKVSLPYTEATILESERWKTLVPLNCLRLATEDTSIQGFNIPKNTVIISNLYNCHMDPKYFESPKDFVPERFLSTDKTRVVLPESFLPFSIGKRNCPGDKMAAVKIFLYFTRIIQKFKLLPPDSGLIFRGLHRINRQADKPVVKVELR